MDKKHITIIGGGITGLSAAWELDSRPDIAYTVLEKDNRWGGKINTEILPGIEKGEFIIDGGPESYITRKPEVWDLSHELDIQEQIRDPGSETSHMFVLDHGEPQPVPLSPIQFIKSPLMSPKGKLRLLAEPFIPARTDDMDESLAEFANRRLGSEAQEKFIGPILAGIYNTDPHRQSILTTSPIMREMEKDWGSLFRAVIGRARQNRKSKSNPDIPRFITFERGGDQMVDALVKGLKGKLLLNTGADRTRKVNGKFAIELSDGTQIKSDAVIMASPANASAEILQEEFPKTASALSSINHHPIGTATLIYKEQDARTRQPINGLMVPRRERRAIDAVTFTSRKMPARSVEGYTLIRVFFGGADPSMVDCSETELFRKILSELNALLGISGNPIQHVTFRWPNSFPQAEVGHLERLSEMERNLPKGLFLAGSSYRGIGVPDCIRQGRDAAKSAIEYLSKN